MKLHIPRNEPIRLYSSNPCGTPDRTKLGTKLSLHENGKPIRFKHISAPFTFENNNSYLCFSDRFNFHPIITNYHKLGLPEIKEHKSNLFLLEIFEIKADKDAINETRKKLLEAVLEDLNPSSVKNDLNSRTFNDTLKFQENFDECNADLSITVGTRTGKPENRNDLTGIDSRKRFRTRVVAFKFLSKYWSVSKNGQISTENVRRSISPLKCIFEYQEEHVFDIPPERKESPKIVIEPFDKSSKKVKGKRKTRKVGRK